MCTKRMIRITKILLLVFSSWIPNSYASSLLVPKTDQAYCQGNLTMNLLGVSCGNENCTFGSTASLYGQVNASSNLPKHANVSVYASMMHMDLTIFSIYHQETGNICKNATKFTPPAGDDAGYYCPKAGLYNVRTNFSIPGSTGAWWSSMYGYNLEFVMVLYDGDYEYSKCTLEVMVKDGDTRSRFSTRTGFLGIVGLSGLAAGIILSKKRKKEPKIEVSDDECNGHFELISDSGVRV